MFYYINRRILWLNIYFLKIYLPNRDNIILVYVLILYEFVVVVKRLNKKKVYIHTYVYVKRIVCCKNLCNS